MLKVELRAMVPFQPVEFRRRKRLAAALAIALRRCIDSD
jgi:hypothetical protein